MNVHQIHFIPKNDFEIDDDVIDLIWDYLSYLCLNGQILNNYEVIQSEDKLFAYATLPTDDALDEKYNNIYVTADLMNLRELFKLSQSLVGENTNEPDSCTGKDSDWFLLYSTRERLRSPLICGDCGDPVPLYKVPNLFCESFFDVIDWQRAFNAVDRLWINCLSDRFTYQQMHNPNSPLSKIGREICKDLQEKTDRPVYYYLFNWEHTSNTCPLCGQDWGYKDEDGIVDFRCDTCMIAADQCFKD